MGLRQLASVMVSVCDPKMVKSSGCPQRPCWPSPCSGAKAAGVMAEQGPGSLRRSPVWLPLLFFRVCTLSMHLSFAGLGGVKAK